MNKSLKLSSLLIAGTLAPAFAAHAASITVNAAAPTVDEADIFSFAATGGHAGAITGATILPDYVSPGDGAPDMDSLWRDRGAQGQSFTTGSNSLGYVLDSFSFKVRLTNSTPVAPITTFRLGIISNADSNTVFTEIASATATPDANFLTGAWLTASFDSSLGLAANTVYAIDFQNTETTSWAGYYFDGDVDSSYLGGSAYTSGLKNQGLDDADLSLPSIDRTFHVNLVAAVPEPSSAALLGLGGIALIIRRRR